MIEIKPKFQVLAICIDCFQYISTGKLDINLNINESALILGTIQDNWPKNRFKLEVNEKTDFFESSDPCDCCDMIHDGNRYVIKAMEIH